MAHATCWCSGGTDSVGRVIAVANQKGGVGKTTTAVNLAACLAVHDAETLLIDGDPQANATSGVGLTVSEGQCTTYEVIMNGVPLADAVVTTNVPRLWAAPAHPRLVGAEVELVDAAARESRLRRALSGTRDSYGYILVDCPPSLGLLTLNALVAADTVVVPIQCEYYALEGLSRLLETVSLVKESLNPVLEIEGVLLTMYDRRVRITEQVAADVRDFFGDKVFATTIPRNVRLSEAPSFGQPIILYDLLSPGAESYMELAKEVMAHG